MAHKGLNQSPRNQWFFNFLSPEMPRCYPPGAKADSCKCKAELEIWPSPVRYKATWNNHLGTQPRGKHDKSSCTGSAYILGIRDVKSPWFPLPIQQFFFNESIRWPVPTSTPHGVALLRRCPVTWAWCVSVVVQMGIGPKWEVGQEGLPVSLSTSQLRIFHYIYISKSM